MRLTSDQSFSIRDHTHRHTLDFDPNAVYITKNISSRSENFSFSIPYPNGFYSARLSHLSHDKNDRAGVTLLAPQRGSDTTPPVISLGGALRVPVYATTTIPLEEIVTELSEYDVSIDIDTTVDADANGIYEDDFVTAGSGVTVTDTELIFGKFDAPGKKTLLLRVQDEFGNVTDMPLTLEIFTPIPRIHHADATGMFSGALDVAVAEEPIDFFRIRNSEMPLYINTGSVWTDEAGIFST